MKSIQQTRNEQTENWRHRTSSHPEGVSEFSPKQTHADITSRASTTRSPFQDSVCKHGIDYASSNDYDSTRITFSQPNHSSTINQTLKSFKGDADQHKLKMLEQVASCSHCFNQMLSKVTTERDSVISKLNDKRHESIQRIKDVTNQIRSTRSSHNSTFKFNSHNCLVNHLKRGGIVNKPAKLYIKNRHISLLKSDMATPNLSNSQISWSSKDKRGRNADHRPKQPRQNSLNSHQSKLRHLPETRDLYKPCTKTVDHNTTTTMNDGNNNVAKVNIFVWCNVYIM